MRLSASRFYVCPQSKAPLRLDMLEDSGEQVLSGTLSCRCGEVFEISHGIPDLTWPRQLASSDMEAKHWAVPIAFPALGVRSRSLSMSFLPT